MQVGTAKAVTLPQSWLELIKRENGQPLKEVTMEVDGCLIIKPLFEKDLKDGVPSRQADRTNPDNHPAKEVTANV